MTLISQYQQFIKNIPYFNGIPALLLRLYLGPIFIMAGISKTQLFSEEISGIASIMADPNIINWFGNSDWGLGLPFPALLANVVVLVELLGGILLIFGVLTRLVTIPLMFTMFVAATSVHADNGWFAITPTNADISPAQILHLVGIEQAQHSLENSKQTKEKLNKIRDILAEHGNTDWLYENGNVVVLNNGIEFSTTYFIMLMALFFIGGGRYTSIDHILVSRYLTPPKYLN